MKAVGKSRRVKEESKKEKRGSPVTPDRVSCSTGFRGRNPKTAVKWLSGLHPVNRGRKHQNVGELSHLVMTHGGNTRLSRSRADPI